MYMLIGSVKTSALKRKRKIRLPFENKPTQKGIDARLVRFAKDMAWVYGRTWDGFLLADYSLLRVD